MTTNGDMTPHRPDDQEPLARLFGEVFDLIDETVTRITDGEVEDQLRRVLDQPGRPPRRPQAPHLPGHPYQDEAVTDDCQAAPTPPGLKDLAAFVSQPECE